MDPRRPAHGFTDVDAQPDPGRWVRCLDLLRSDPFFAAYKARVREILEPTPAGRYLEVGAGTGEDALELARVGSARVYALDASYVMMAEARRRGLRTAAVGRAEDLPFRDCVFDGCWADRVFQHLESPERGLAELHRVTRAGGCVLVVDPDYGTQAMSFPDQGLAASVLRFRAEQGLRQGALASRMPGLFVGAGFGDVSREARTLAVHDAHALDGVFGLRSWARAAAAAGHLGMQEALRWEALLDEVVASGGFHWQVTFYVTWGIRVA